MQSDIIGSKSNLWIWSFTGVLLLVSLVLLIRKSSSPSLDQKFIRQEEDSEDFKTALVKYYELFPPNPRDIVRMVNRIRMTYLIQSKKGNESKDTYGGEELNEEECVSLTILQMLYPNVFNTETIEKTIMSNLPENGILDDIPGFYCGLAESNDEFTTVAECISKLEKNNFPLDHFVDSEKLERFKNVNVYAFGGRAPGKKKQPDTIQKKQVNISDSPEQNGNQSKETSAIQKEPETIADSPEQHGSLEIT